MFCMLTCLFVSSVLLPNYLTDYLHMGMQQMGFVMSAIGFGGFCAMMVMPAVEAPALSWLSIIYFKTYSR